jgi:hypothetical protein
MRLLLGLFSVVAFSVAPSFAADGHVSSASLSKMGLSGMKAMTDAQGMQIRGLSIAVVSGGSGAHLLGAGGGSSFYAKGDGYGTHYAEGSSSSTASDSLSIKSGWDKTTVTFTASASTYAQAKAH